VRADLCIKPEEITCIPCTETPRAPLMRAPSTQTESQTSQYFLDEEDMEDMEVGGGRKRKRSNSRTKKQRRSLYKKRRATRKMRRR